MKDQRKFIWLLFALPVLLSCTKSNADKNKAEILHLLKDEQPAHMTRNADLFISEFGDSTYRLYNGELNRLSKSEIKKQVSNYFNSSKIIKWDDMEPPVIRVSGDGTMAYALVKKIVVTEQLANNVRHKKDTTIFSWVSIYSKTGDDWKVTCNVSNNK